MIKAFYVMVLILMQAPAWAELPYPQPFPGTINSGFGPRLNDSSFHRGLDYKRKSGTPIPAIMDGYIKDLIVSNISGGNRLYVVNSTDGKEIGYMHLFRDIKEEEVTSGQFILLKNHKFTFPAPSGLRSKEIVKTCVVIVNTANKKAYIPKACWTVVKRLSPGGNVIVNHKNIPYAGTNTVVKNEKIAPVGNSGTKDAHLHLQYGRADESKHPMYVLEPTGGNGQIYARLDLTGTDTNNTNVPQILTIDPSISQDVLAQNKFIDVRVDSTNSLDLDAFVFTINATNPTKPNLSGNVQYSFPNRSINSTAKTINEFKKSISITTCLRDLKPGDVVMCPEVIWMGQKSGQRLVTRFRLGIDPDMFAQGRNTVNVTLKHANQSLNTLQIIPPLNFTVETGPMGITLLSASCNQIDDFSWLVTNSGTAFGPIGTSIGIAAGSSDTRAFRSASCGNWGIITRPDFSFPLGCIRESGQPDSTTWTISGTSLGYLDTQKNNLRSFYAIVYEIGNPRNLIVRSNELPITCDGF